MKKCIVLSSGGVDSTTCIAVAIQKYGSDNVISLSANYGQRHIKELKSAKEIAKFYNLKHIELDMAKLFSVSDCPLLSSSTNQIPSASYKEQLDITNGLKPVSTYVPFRNGVFLSCATVFALSVDAETIYYGAHSDDSCGNAYPDCSDKFVKYMNSAIYEGSGKLVHCEAPFVNKTKRDIVKIGLELNVPYELTWSCYNGGMKPCRKCGTCIDREQAFLSNGVIDPLLIGE